MVSWSLLSFLLLLSTILFSVHVFGAPQEDEVSYLPLIGNVHQYSGYLDATAGCDTEANGPFCKLHYWFAPSTRVPNDGPVLLWLNGGPGSSSVLGMLQELGPYLINATGELMENPWSWTNLAHLLILESPIGVGYSYCANQLQGKLCKNTDKFTASATRAALIDFFDNKFPELRNNPFFITGESYAGVYIPTLTKDILDNAPTINLKGIAVGDPCTDTDAQADSMDELWYGHKNGLVTDATFDKLWNQCGVRPGSRLMRKDKSRPPKHKITRDISCDEHNDGESCQLLDQSFPKDFERLSEGCRMEYFKFVMSTSKRLSETWKNMFIDEYTLFGPMTDQEDDHMTNFMNRPDVKKALHVEETPIESWPDYELGFDYTSEFDACVNIDLQEGGGAVSMIDFYREVAPKLSNVWIYNGDADPAVSYEGTRIAIARVGFPQIDGGGYRPWFFNQTASPPEILTERGPLFGPNLLSVPMGAQFGGEVVNYENNLTFLTVHGSGHMVPQFRPQAALHMLKKFLKNEPLSPLWPSNATLKTLTRKTFRKTLNKWTLSAKGAPYVDAVEYQYHYQIMGGKLLPRFPRMKKTNN